MNLLRKLFLTIVAVAIAPGSWSAEDTVQKAVMTNPWGYWVEPFRIVGDLYFVGNASVSSHLIDTGEGLILLDTGYPQTAYMLLESIRRLGSDPDDIVYIVHSHGHYDHMGGTRSIVELTGAKTMLGKADMEILTSRPELVWGRVSNVPFYGAFEVDRELIDGDRISLGNTSIECVATPGHTAGSMSFFFIVTELGSTYTVGMHGGPGPNTLTDEYLKRHKLPKSRRTDYMSSLRRLQKQHVDIHIGSHPRQSETLEKRERMREGHNPFIDEASWPRFLSRLEANVLKRFGVEKMTGPR